MAEDRYSSFKVLYASEKEGTDYRKEVVRRNSKCLIMAPHGGKIERGTSEVASRVAGDDHSLFLFEGLRKRPHRDLHVTSHKYDDEEAIELAREHALVVAFHGRKDRKDPVTVHVGGLDVEIRDAIITELKLSDFEAAVGTGEFAGQHESNICNRSNGSRGVQLEIPKSLRDKLRSKPDEVHKFASAVRKAIASK